jgi:hypothetical protein
MRKTEAVVSLPSSPQQPLALPSLTETVVPLMPSMPSEQLGISSGGLKLPLPPMALAADSATSTLPVQPQQARTPLAVGASLRPGATIIEPQIPVAQATHTRQVAQAQTEALPVFEQPAARERAPAVRADEFIPMRGVKVY